MRVTYSTRSFYRRIKRNLDRTVQNESCVAVLAMYSAIYYIKWRCHYHGLLCGGHELAQTAGERTGSDYAHARYADTEHYARLTGVGPNRVVDAQCSGKLLTTVLRPKWCSLFIACLCNHVTSTSAKREA
jgi:hypothetical protein